MLVFVLITFILSNSVAQNIHLSSPRCQHAGVGVGGKAIFAGGLTNIFAPDYLSTVDYCDTTGCVALDESRDLSQARVGLAGASTGSKALFGGGSNGALSAVVDLCDPNPAIGCTPIQGNGLSQARDALAAASTSNNAVLFGGGFCGSCGGTGDSKVVDWCDENGCTDLELLLPTLGRLTVARSFLAAASDGTNVYFSGGSQAGGNSFIAEVDICSLELGCRSPSTPGSTLLSVARSVLAGVFVNGKALFAGGSGPALGQEAMADVDNCDTAACSHDFDLSSRRAGLSGGFDGTFALFGGGADDTNTPTTTVDRCSITACEPIAPPLFVARSFMASASVGSFVFFAGGRSDAFTILDTVDYCNSEDGCKHISLTGGGDPVFYGFDGKKLSFHGKPNKAFHIYSDPYLSINSRFVTANPHTKHGTVMNAFGIRWENHTIIIEVNSASKNQTSVTLLIDGVPVSLAKSRKATLLDDCIRAKWWFPRLTIITPLHSIEISWKYSNTAHINGSYLNIRLSIPLELPQSYGGVLGQTAAAMKALTKVSKKDTDFITHNDLISTDAKTNKYTMHPMLCAAVATQPPSVSTIEGREDDEVPVRPVD